MGGEPTFVSIDDMDGDEWNTAAIGPTKQRLAGALVRRLRETFAPGGLLHFGQGKWYPGESLPRWAFTCYWRSDGVPLWHDPALVADPDRPGGSTEADAERFAKALAERLAVGKAHVIAAYEDPLVYIHQEGQLPVNVDPEHNTLDDPEERERLRKVFSRGLGRPTGFVLPLARARGKDGPTWQSGLWMLRAQHLFLIPGDSPVGFRLPLHALVAEPADVARQVWPVDPMGPWPPLLVPVRRAAPRQHQNLQPFPVATEGPVVRTALSVEAREGALRVFLPPVESGDDFVDLLAAVEDVAAALHQPVLVEALSSALRSAPSRLRSHPTRA